jgi:hypothetical protein
MGPEIDALRGVERGPRFKGRIRGLHHHMDLSASSGWCCAAVLTAPDRPRNPLGPPSHDSHSYWVRVPLAERCAGQLYSQVEVGCAMHLTQKTPTTET